MNAEEFAAHLMGVSKFAYLMHTSRNDAVVLTWLTEEMKRSDLTASQRSQITAAATSWIRI